MSTAVPFWNYFWHILALIFIVLICLPTAYWRKINQRFAVHRLLPPDLVTEMRYQFDEVPVAERIELINAYNDGNFLYKKMKVTNPEAGFLEWRVPSRAETYQVYPSSPYVEVVKQGRRKTTIFTLQSKGLHDWLNGKGSRGSG